MTWRSWIPKSKEFKWNLSCMMYAILLLHTSAAILWWCLDSSTLTFRNLFLSGHGNGCHLSPHWSLVAVHHGADAQPGTRREPAILRVRRPGAP